MGVMSLSEFRDRTNAESGLAEMEEALNLDEGSDPTGLSPSMVREISFRGVSSPHIKSLAAQRLPRNTLNNFAPGSRQEINAAFK